MAHIRRLSCEFLAPIMAQSLGRTLCRSLTLAMAEKFDCQPLLVRQHWRQVTREVTTFSGEDDFALRVQCIGGLHPARDDGLPRHNQLGDIVTEALAYLSELQRHLKLAFEEIRRVLT